MFLVNKSTGLMLVKGSHVQPGESLPISESDLYNPEIILMLNAGFAQISETESVVSKPKRSRG